MAFLTHDAMKKNFIGTQFRGDYDEPEVVEFPELVSLTPIAQPAEAADEAEPTFAFGEAPLRTWDQTGLAVVPTAVADEGAETFEGDAAAGSVSAVGLLALAQKLHDEFVAEGQSTRERLISEGQSHHDQVVGEATARHDELLTTGQAKYDEFVSIGQAKHEALVAEATALVSDANAEHEHIIAEARERSAGMIAQAKQEKSDVLHELGGERSLLKNEIEELRVLERDHRARLKSYLESQLLELEHTGSQESTPAEGASDVNQQNDGQRNDG